LKQDSTLALQLFIKGIFRFIINASVFDQPYTVRTALNSQDRTARVDNRYLKGRASGTKQMRQDDENMTEK
jgi:hypothetical protein